MYYSAVVQSEGSAKSRKVGHIVIGDSFHAMFDAQHHHAMLGVSVEWQLVLAHSRT